jgi:hypothetical protein
MALPAARAIRLYAYKDQAPGLYQPFRILLVLSPTNGDDI